MSQKNLTIDDSFDFYPDIEILQRLAKGSSLKQNLPKAVRLWVILRSIYGSQTDPVKVELEKEFSYNDWCKAFFTDFEYHKNDKVPENHDENCPCAKTISEWLFEPNIGSDEQEWKKSFIQFYSITEEELNNLLNFGSTSVYKNEKLRLLAKTRRNFQNDFQALVSMDFLQVIKVNKNNHVSSYTTQYIKVSSFPNFFTNSPSQDVIENQEVGHIIQNALADFWEDFGQKINNEQRFFLDIEYIVHHDLSQTINNFRKKLKEIWAKQPIPPLKITYVSASKYQERQHDGEDYIVYPVCIYYSQRAPYLFTYGQTPEGDSSTIIDWYDYRIDRIKKLKVLEWSEVNLPNFSLKVCELKTPSEIENKRYEAWGFDFYRPKDVLVIRFDRYFHNRYIQGTERENLFKNISYRQAQSLIQGLKDNLQYKSLLLKILKSRFPGDIYCRANYRKGDKNIIMRLRAWGPQVEVLYPWDLRQTMTEDIQKTWDLYKT